MGNFWQSWVALSRSGKVASVLMALMLAPLVVECVGATLVLALADRTGPADIEVYRTLALMPSLGLLADSVVYVPCAIAFLVWFRARFRALAKMGVTGLAHTSAQSVYLYFIPFVSIYAPLRVAQEIWRASNPGVAVYDSKDLSGGSGLIRFWWWSFILYGAAMAIAATTLQWAVETPERLEALGNVAEMMSRLVTASWYMVGASVLGISSGVLAIRVIMVLERRQREKSQTPPLAA